jgi:hypothetical protein
MTSRPHFDDLNRRYSETDWVSEFQRLWAIFNHWLVLHVEKTQDRECIESLKTREEISTWITRIIRESQTKRTQRIADGVIGSILKFRENNSISRMFRDVSASSVIEPRLNYPWRPGVEKRIRKITSIAISEDMFVKAYRVHGVFLQDNMDFDLTLHQTLELVGVFGTGCCFYRNIPPSTGNKSKARELVNAFRAIPKLADFVSMIDSVETSSIVNDTIETLYNVRNTAMHGSLDFLDQQDNQAAHSACDVLNSLIQDIRDNW